MKKYEKPELEVVTMSLQNIIVTSTSCPENNDLPRCIEDCLIDNE